MIRVDFDPKQEIGLKGVGTLSQDYAHIAPQKKDNDNGANQYLWTKWQRSAPKNFWLF